MPGGGDQRVRRSRIVGVSKRSLSCDSAAPHYSMHSPCNLRIALTSASGAVWAHGSTLGKPRSGRCRIPAKCAFFTQRTVTISS